MIHRFILICVLTCTSYLASIAQIEQLIIETYYITDANDATDTIGGQLEAGSTTYRIYVDLLPGSRLLSIYGDENHPLVFSSSAPFFNHREEGISFGKDLSRNRYEIGTVALDSYITLGQCSRSFSQGAYFGIPKNADTDGSVIGGPNNDGGSAAIATGLLANSQSQIGQPLTQSDGLMVVNPIPGSWVDVGFIDLLSNADTTIFGSAEPKDHFNRQDVVLKNAGTKGVDSIRNEVLVAQLTTKGEIAFELNLEVEFVENGIPQIVKYVARNEALKDQEIFVPFLKVPYTCGCKDPDYLEASPDYACEDNSLCKTLIVLGCTDTMACNFNPDANFNVEDLCCYIGFCHDLDISVVCPDLRPRIDGVDAQVIVYPNPAVHELQFDIDIVERNTIGYTIYDMYGRSTGKGVIEDQAYTIDVSSLVAGIYTLQLQVAGHIIAPVPFVKL